MRLLLLSPNLFDNDDTNKYAIHVFNIEGEEAEFVEALSMNNVKHLYKAIKGDHFLLRSYQDTFVVFAFTLDTQYLFNRSK